MATRLAAVDIDPRRLQNLRDLGGLALAHGGVLASGVLYRSDAPREGDGDEPHLAWPPRTVLDLRSGPEAGDHHPLASAGADVVALPLSPEASIEHLLTGPRDAPDDLGVLYVRMLTERAAEIAQAACLLAAAPAPILVHCAAGKDRTGTLVAIVLLAVGVDEDAVIADYLETGARMDDVLRRVAADPAFAGREADVERMQKERPALFTVSEPAIRAVIAHLAERGGAARWLVDNGLSEAELARLRARLVAAV